MGNIDWDFFSEVDRAVGVLISGTWVLLVARGGVRPQPACGMGSAPLRPGLSGRETCGGHSKASSAVLPELLAGRQACGQQGLGPSSGDLEGSALPSSGIGQVRVGVGLSSACLSEALSKVAAILHPHPLPSLRCLSDTPLRCS